MISAYIRKVAVRFYTQCVFLLNMIHSFCFNIFLLISEIIILNRSIIEFHCYVSLIINVFQDSSQEHRPFYEIRTHIYNNPSIGRGSNNLAYDRWLLSEEIRDVKSTVILIVLSFYRWFWDILHGILYKKTE